MTGQLKPLLQSKYIILPQVTQERLLYHPTLPPTLPATPDAASARNQNKRHPQTPALRILGSYSPPESRHFGFKATKSFMQ